MNPPRPTFPAEHSVNMLWIVASEAFFECSNMVSMFKVCENKT